ncbi:hypothetical protein BaRGS_00038364 [Batillaria attramentaria]|uniref:Uncharacterized protein n=1 Tax=Batillaria attramentaria TaxID=370345 RepID=A0ABD0J7G2_9CAEN
MVAARVLCAHPGRATSVQPGRRRLRVSHRFPRCRHSCATRRHEAGSTWPIYFSRPSSDQLTESDRSSSYISQTDEHHTAIRKGTIFVTMTDGHSASTVADVQGGMALFCME